MITVQGTLGLEIIEQLPNLDYLFIAVGGGGSGSTNRFKLFLFFSVKLLFTRIINNQFDFGHSGGGSGYIEWAETSIAGHFALVGSSNDCIIIF